MTDEAIVLAALGMHSPAERQAFLHEACGGDAARRARVKQRLDAETREPGGPPADATGAYAPAVPPVRSARNGVVIAGRYKLLEEIGEGGMGTVWIAEQTEPVRRKVALKLIKPGLDSRSVLARFEAERQALAMMDHPNIAKVLDGGMTDAGRPFFVMEYVKGVPITEYCDTGRLNVPERLDLFVQVCRAVQHAHQKGIIHRDLKPSNILVAQYDDRPVPKVIDFGLAKAMHHSLTERTLHTVHGTAVGTPLYMSPEQAELNNLDVDTRSDIYSLGVLLYELLTGTTPLEKKRFQEAAWEEMRRVIREEDPPKPSVRLSTVDTLPSLAACRHTEPANLRKLVRGELDWIVMKSLEKDRNRRYESANGFAMDVQRYLAGEAVLAAPPSAAYRVRKFVRRHWTAVTVTGLLLLALAAGAVGTTMGLIEARRQWALAEDARAQEADQRLRAEQASALARRNAAAARDVVDQFLVRLGDDRFSEVPGFEPVRKEMLDLAVKRYRDLVRQQPDDDALLSDAAQAFRRSANLYRMVGRTAEARAVYADAIAAAKEVVRKQPGSAPYRRRLAEIQSDLGTVILRSEGPKAAEPTFREALETAKQLREEAGSDADVLVFAARTELDLSDVLHERGQNAEALTLARSAARAFSDLADRPQAKPVIRLLAAFAWNNVAQAARGSNQDKVANEAIAEALRRVDDGLRINPRDTNLRYTRAWAKLEAGRDKEASQSLDEAVAELERLVAEFPRTANFGRKFAEALTVRGRQHLAAARPAEAAADARRALDNLEKLERQPGWAINLDAPFVSALTVAAKAALLQGQNAAAAPLYETARRRLESGLTFNPESESLRISARELEDVGRQIGPPK